MCPTVAVYVTVSISPIFIDRVLLDQLVIMEIQDSQDQLVLRDQL